MVMTGTSEKRTTSRYWKGCVGAKAALLPQTAPLLKALWEAEVVDEAVVAEWAKADGGGGKAQRWAQPFVDWLREVPEAEAETE